MLRPLTTAKFKSFSFFLLIAVFLFSQFPGKGGLEGDQREIVDISNRTDNWGFLVPFVFGNWPNVLGHWRFSLVLLQLSLYWLGMWLLLRNSWSQGKWKRYLIIFFIIFSSIFVSQLWRDASLLAVASLGFGLCSRSLNAKGIRGKILMILGIFCLHFAAMFKVLYGVVLGMIFIWIVYQSKSKRRQYTIVSTLVLLSLTVSPYLMDKALGRMVGLQKVYIEQQPIVLDLASSYCWGTSNRLVQDAENGLEIVKRPEFTFESICKSLKPVTSDALNADTDKLEAPLERIRGDQDQRVKLLREKWLSMILASPVDWIQVRLMYLGPTLTLSNSFVPQNQSNTWDGVLGKINSSLWSFFFTFASVLDKSRVSSILFAFLLLGMLTIQSAFKSFGDRKIFFLLIENQLIGFLVLIATTILTMVGFVASNGRYVLPYVLLVYALLLRSKTITVASSNHRLS